MAEAVSPAHYRIGIDTGGTFTDIVSVDIASGATAVTKVASTPANPGIALVRGVRAILDQVGGTSDSVVGIAHGTTVATNALLQGQIDSLGLMKAAVVLHAGSLPVYADFEAPPPTPGAQRIAVTTAALSAVVKSRVSGAHYSASGNFPFIAGIDGVGRTEDGRRVYFILPPAPYGSMAEVATAPDAQCVPLPNEIDDTTAAAIANPGLSSWSALTQRARLVAGETVLINGATGTSGRLAVQVAKRLGAAKVIATARSGARLQALTALGADETVVLSEDNDALDLAFKKHFAAGVDIVLDYLWGRSAERLIVAAKAGPEAVPIRFVQLGNSSGANITLPASAIRSSTVEMMGCGIGSVPLNCIVRAITDVLHAAAKKPFDFPTITAPLSDVERAWTTDEGMPRLVFKL